MLFKDFVKLLIRSHGLTPASLVKQMDRDGRKMNRKTVFNWLKRDTAPKGEGLEKVADFFAIPIQVFEDAANGRTPLPEQFMDRDAWLERRGMLSGSADIFIKQRATPRPQFNEHRAIRIHGEHAATQTHDHPDSEHIDRESTIPLHLVEYPGAIAIRVTGESMEPVYRNGDLIVVISVPFSDLRSGEEAYVRLAGGESAFKRVVRSGGGEVTLLPLNDRYEQKQIDEEDILEVSRIVGTFRYKSH